MNDFAKYDDIIDLLCGNLLGEGISRKVFVCSLNPKWVVKVENLREGYYQNIKEHKIWEEIEHWKKMSKWFAPCVSLSPSGMILIQERTEPIRLEDVPEKLPSFLQDHKLDNYGILNGNFVCHDYGTIPMSKNWSTRLAKHSFTKDF